MCHLEVNVGLYVRAQIGEKGRLVIPAQMREALGIKPGDSVELRLEDHEVRISTRRARIKRAQERVRQVIPPGISLSEELSAERREAATHE
jgi:AbrB family looped-hinge helix DNA binding protein